MKDSIPEIEALRLLLEKCRHLVVFQGQDAFKKINAEEARSEADRLDLLVRAEASLDALRAALEAFPELFAEKISVPNPVPPEDSREHKNESVIDSRSLGQKVCIASKIAHAIGYWDGEKFTIEAGSQMRLDEVPSIQASIKSNRKHLIDEGAVIKKGAAYVFVKNAALASPSAAAGVVLGRTADGPQEWKLPDGTPLGKMTPKEFT